MKRKKLAIALASTLLTLGVGTIGYYAYCSFSMKNTPVVEAHEDDYTCPMHPTVHSDHPGSCPVCGMNLVKQTKKEVKPSEQGEHAAMSEAGLGEVALSPQQMVTANVTVTTVEPKALAREIRSPGKVSFDETLQSNVTSWVAGRIDRLYVAQTGQYIGKGQAIAEIYSPDLLAAQQEYLTALESSRALGRNSFPEIAQGARQLLQSAHSRLRLLGVTDSQIARLKQTRRPQVDMTIYSPVSGTVTQKIAQLGQFVGQGQPLFQVADLSRVWIEAPIYEDQLASVKLGQSALLTATAYPGQVFRGRISFISPVVDPQTRTVQARLSLGNAGGKLKPEMFVETRIQVPLGNTLAVPASAVVDTGSRKVVWIEQKPNTFIPREVQLGARSGDSYPVLSGLTRGERIAATGAYLIDSSSQMRSLGAGSMPGHDMSKMKPGETMPESPNPHQGHGGM
ncbi:MAG: efflux RND transporter periplasmic adaptor subunit [Bacteroidota bacterium]